LCPSGQGHQPKFSHYASLHQTIIGIASTLLQAETALEKAKNVTIMDNDGNWSVGTEQHMFLYVTGHKGQKAGKSSEPHCVVFVENDTDKNVIVKLPSDRYGSPGTETFSLSPYSAILVVNGINLQFMSFNPVFDCSSSAPMLLDWLTWPEPIGAALNDPNARIGKAPVEQTRLNIRSSVLSQYAWYDTFLEIEESSKNIQFFVETQRSNGILIYVDGM
jgi:hypothetical protein